MTEIQAERFCKEGICTVNSAMLPGFKHLKSGKTYTWHLVVQTSEGKVKSAAYLFTVYTRVICDGPDTYTATCVAPPSATRTKTRTPTPPPPPTNTNPPPTSTKTKTPVTPTKTKTPTPVTPTKTKTPTQVCMTLMDDRCLSYTNTPTRTRTPNLTHVQCVLPSDLVGSALPTNLPPGCSTEIPTLTWTPRQPTNTKTSTPQLATSTPLPTATPVLPLPQRIIEFDINRFSARTLAECQGSSEINFCWNHVSYIFLMDYLGVTGITHEQLIKVLIESEYRATIRSITQQNQYWPTEALARRFYHECGTNGCQTQNDELYNFLEYYSAARNGALDDVQQDIYDLIAAASSAPYWQEELDNLNNATNLLFNPSNQGWFNGVLANTPYGFANTEKPIASEAEAENFRQRLAYCNSERFAIWYQKSGVFTVFFGTTITTDGAMVYPPAPLAPIICTYVNNGEPR